MTEVEKLLNSGETAYVTPEVSIIFNVEPSYSAIAKARALLDAVTDTLILRDLDKQ